MRSPVINVKQYLQEMDGYIGYCQMLITAAGGRGDLCGK